MNVVSFGKIASIQVEGDVFAQPLYVPQVKTPDSLLHNLVFVATMHDQVYAIDANSHQIVWHRDFIDTPGVGVVQQDDFPQSCGPAEVGIMGTPTIDTAASTLYLVVRTKETTGEDVAFYQRLHALDLATGAEKVPATTITTPADPDKKFWSAAFQPLYNNQRPGLLLDHGQVYVAWASNCDLGTYQGWVMSFDSKTLQNTGGWTSAPDGWASGIWMSGSGPAADENGDVYVTTGNGWSDVMSGQSDYGNAVVKLRDTGGPMDVADYFIPYNWENLFDDDYDVAAGGPVLLPAQPNSPHTHKMVLAGKEATVYLLDRDNMGQWHPDDNSQIIQTFKANADRSFHSPAVFKNYLYFGFMNSPLQAYVLDSSTDQINTTPASSTVSFTCIYPGCTPSVSANGDSNGIVWALSSTQTTSDFRAFDATDLTHELWSNQMSPTRDQAPSSVHFAVPTVADGMVFIAGQGEVAIYGLLP